MDELLNLVAKAKGYQFDAKKVISKPSLHEATRKERKGAQK
jgi:hypothetical protein